MSKNLVDLAALGLQAQFATTKAPTVLLVGQAGVGKNKGCVEPVAEALGKALVTLPAPRYEASDFNGYPAPDFEKGVMRMLPPDWAKTVSDNGPKNFVIFVDELADADSKTQAACHGMFQDGSVADLNLEGAAFIANMNPPEIATTGGTISHPISNRSLVIQYSPDKSWIAEQMTTGSWDSMKPKILPDGWESGIKASMMMVGTFLSRFSHHLRISPEDLIARGEDIWKPANTDRSWEHFWILRAAAIASNQQHLMLDIAQGTVGAPGLEFLTWERDLDLGDPEDFIQNPHARPLPEEDDKLFALVSMVTSAIAQNTTPARWESGWKFLQVCKQQNRGDLAVMGVRALVVIRPKGANMQSPALRELASFAKQAGIFGGE